MVELREIQSSADVVNSELRSWIEKQSHVEVTHDYTIVFEGQEVGGLQLDHHREDGLGRFDLCLYSLYILPAFRSRGIGAAAVSAVLELAKRLGYHSVFLKPFQIDPESSWTQERLASWYTTLGFTLDLERSGDLWMRRRIE